MTYASHRIRSQRWEVRAPDRDTAFALRAQLRRDVDDVLLPALEQAFDAAGVGEEVIRIPRLAVHLRVRNLDEFAATLAEQLPALIAEQLDAALNGVTRVTASTRRRGAIEQRRASLVHYLHGGQLDWPDMQGEVAAQVASLREEAIGLARSWREEPAALRRSLPAQFASLVAFFFRFLQLLPDAIREEWLAAVLEAGPHATAEPRRLILQGLRALPAHTALTTHGLLRVQASVLAIAWVESVPPENEWLPDLLALPGLNASGIQAFTSRLRGGKEVPRMAQGTNALPQAGTRQDDSPQSHAKEAGPSPESSARHGENAIEPDTDLQLPDAIDRDALTPPVPPATARAEVEDTAVMRVQAAGLVLAHPFLSSLFDARGLLGEDGKTLSPRDLPRAAALLHWLACGREEVFEFELGLIKPLLGLRPADPLPLSQGLLNDGDREECQALLTAIISHWPALRSTSVEGLQLSFLQRQGLLRETEAGLNAGWQLQLESESFDMLLAQLPWSISIVRLPWMTRPIFTDWPTR